MVSVIRFASDFNNLIDIMMIWIIVNKCILQLWLKETMIKGFKIATRKALNSKKCYLLLYTGHCWYIEPRNRKKSLTLESGINVAP